MMSRQIVKTLLCIFLVFLTVISVKAQTVRSYMEREIVGQSVQGPISEVPQHAGTWVEWDASGDVITMMDGTRWRQTGSVDGQIHYRYAGSTQQPAPYTQLIEAVFNQDFSRMNIRYSFGTPGMGISMIGVYRYLGDGKQFAEDWINMPDDQ